MYEFSRKVRGQVLDRDLNRCVRCARHLRDGAHLHHRKLRSQGGEGTVQNAVTLCGPCHSYVHEHPAVAKASGLIVPSWDDPEAVPVATWRGLVILDDVGGFVNSTPHPDEPGRVHDW